MLGQRGCVGGAEIGGLEVVGGIPQRDHEQHRDADADEDRLEALRELAADLLGILGRGRRIATLRVLRRILGGAARRLQIVRFRVGLAGRAPGAAQRRL